MSTAKQPSWTVFLFLLLISSALVSEGSVTARRDVTPTPLLVARLATPTPEQTATPLPTLPQSPTLESLATALPTTPPLHTSEIDFPLALNNTWVFQVTRSEGFNTSEIITTTLVITETVVELKRTSPYLVAQIHRDESAEKPVAVPKSMQGIPVRPATSSEYWLVIDGNRIYRQENKLDLSNLGEALLKFVFPLKVGAKWYQVDNGLPRQVTKVDRVTVPTGQFENCFFLQEEWADATFEEWFCPNVGIVDQKGDHHGTPEGFHQILISYQLEK